MLNKKTNDLINCAKDSEKRGKQLEESGKKVKSCDQNSLLSGSLIEKYGQDMQNHAQASCLHALNAEQSVEEYAKAEQEHRQESETFMKAMKEYMKWWKNKLSRWQEFF